MNVEDSDALIQVMYHICEQLSHISRKLDSLEQLDSTLVDVLERLDTLAASVNNISVKP
jgi:prefoldin subunit 5